MWRDSLTFSEVSWLLSEVSQTSPCLFDALNLFLAQANKKTNKKKPESFIRLHPPIAADTVPAGRLSRCHDLLGLLNTTEPSLMLLGTPFFNRDKRKVHLVWHHPAAATLTWDRRLSLTLTYEPSDQLKTIRQNDWQLMCGCERPSRLSVRWNCSSQLHFFFRFRNKQANYGALETNASDWS